MRPYGYELRQFIWITYREQRSLDDAVAEAAHSPEVVKTQSDINVKLPIAVINRKRIYINAYLSVADPDSSSIWGASL